MNQEQTNITTGKQIRHLRTQLGMTQEELAGELNVTRQALSNWERDVNEPDLNMLKKICFLFGVNMDDFAKEVITKMETYEKKEKRQFNKYDMAIGLFYGVGIFLGIGIFFVGGFMTMSGAGWGASLFGGGCFSLVFGLICHAVIRNAPLLPAGHQRALQKPRHRQQLHEIADAVYARVHLSGHLRRPL